MSESTRYLWKVVRWLVLGALLLVIILMLRNPVPITRPMDQATTTQKAAEFQAKIQHLADAHQSGERAEARLETDEVNAALQQATTQAASPQSAAAPAIQTTQVFFRDDTVVGQFTTQLYGKDVVVTLAGRLASKDGYVTFAPTEFKIGDMPIPVSMVESALQRKLAEPENREKLKLQQFVSDVHIEHGQLVIVEQ